MTKENINWPYKNFDVPKYIKNYWEQTSSNNEKKRIKWEQKLKNSKLKNDFLNQYKPLKFLRDEKTFEFLKKLVKSNNPEATRKSSQKCLEYFYSKHSNILGGSADLTGSNLTKVDTSATTGKNTNYIHYGVREHIMAAAMNGISLHGGYVPYGGTFLVFSDYCRHAIRLSAMMKQKIIYVFTHDSVGLGEDGPTHQPVEHLASLRAIPNLNILRPCDAIETFESWEIALNSSATPSILALSRQNLPRLRKNFKENKSIKGAYFLKRSNKSKISLFASGSEVEIAINIFELLLEKGIESNVISVPSTSLFDKQSQSYKEKVLGSSPRVFIEAGVSDSWYKYTERDDSIFGIDFFGESGKAKDVFDYFGLEPNKIFKKFIKSILDDYTKKKIFRLI